MRIKWKELEKAALIEMSGSFLLLLCMFLPWMSFSFEGMNDISFSLANRIVIRELISWLNSCLTEQLGDSKFILNYGYLLYIFPALCVLNIVIQCFVRVSWISFYTAVFSILTAFSVYYFIDCNVGGYSKVHDGSIGIGFILAAIISVLMVIHVWTNLAWHYKKHWIYLSVTLFLGIVSLIILTHAHLDDSFYALCLCFGTMHIPFLIYAFLVSVCSWFINSRK